MNLDIEPKESSVPCFIWLLIYYGLYQGRFRWIFCSPEIWLIGLVGAVKKAEQQSSRRLPLPVRSDCWFARNPHWLSPEEDVMMLLLGRIYGQVFTGGFGHCVKRRINIIIRLVRWFSIEHRSYCIGWLLSFLVYLFSSLRFSYYWYLLLRVS